jgi:hypothetical protein
VGTCSVIEYHRRPFGIPAGACSSVTAGARRASEEGCGGRAGARRGSSTATVPGPCGARTDHQSRRWAVDPERLVDTTAVDVAAQLSRHTAMPARAGSTDRRPSLAPGKWRHFCYKARNDRRYDAAPPTASTAKSPTPRILHTLVPKAAASVMPLFSVPAAARRHPAGCCS